jgi:hypothetical protein
MATIFEEIISPLKQILKSKGKEIDIESDSRSLYFQDFILKLVYANLIGISSLRSLITDLETSQITKQLGFEPTPFSTFRDGFSRFKSKFVYELFQELLRSSPWLSIPSIDELGIIKLVDGSIFPTISSMDWATYTKYKNGIKLHLSFDLNRMIPTEFLTTHANSSERFFLISILKAGVTYIADRGYFSFDIGQKIKEAEAFFIIRIKENLKLEVIKSLNISFLEKIPSCFDNVKDELIRFTNDKHDEEYRLISFIVAQSKFLICTNRMDLTTLQVIILYAYRWQIELLFKFIKRTINGIHLFNHSENGVNIHFSILMIAALLQLRFKQFCTNYAQFTSDTDIDDAQSVKNIEHFITYWGHNPSCWINSITKKFYKYWKIGKHWLIRMRNSITLQLDYQTILLLAKT